MKKAIITGITGQDGSYLSELLVEKGYKVYGISRRNSVTEHQSFKNKNPLNKAIDIEFADLTDMPSLSRIINLVKPDHLYNLAAQSHVRMSFEQPIYTSRTINEGTINLLECIKSNSPKTKFYQAGSSEMFGNSIDSDGFQRESTPMKPVSPYGCAKLFAYNIVRVYRKSYNIFASNGILFNHESPRRGIDFVTSKIIRNALLIKKGEKEKLTLGNLEARRDWGHAKDYVRAMELILNHNVADDFVCAAGQTNSVRDFAYYVFNKLELPTNLIETSSRYLRPYDLKELKGDSKKLKKETGWKPEYTFHEMIDEMIDYWDKTLN